MKKGKGDAAALEISQDQLRACLERIRPRIEAADYAIIAALVAAYLKVMVLLSAARVSVERLKKLVFGKKTERSRDIFPGSQPQGNSDGSPGPEGDPSTTKPTPKSAGGSKFKGKNGHGRNGVTRYPGAEKIIVHHETFTKGCLCPECEKGKLYQTDPEVVLRILGQPALLPKIWEAEQWRCNLCQRIFHTQLPVEARGPKYDVTAVAMLAVQHFGNGLPYHRLAQHQRDMRAPVAASTMSELLSAAATRLLPAFDELKRSAAQGKVLHNDDTGNRILSRMKALRAVRDLPDEKKPSRTGTFTTGIASVVGVIRIALYMTGEQHAGENLDDLLQKRESGRAPPIHMSDGLEHNAPRNVKTVTAKCLAHARRLFVEIATFFPAATHRVLEVLREVYRVDALARARNLSDEDRLFLHQEKSGPIMERLRRWLVDQLLGTDVEPNSSLGEAIKYMIKRWDPLTLFLRVPGAPLDNNPAERNLKLAIRHRRNSLFFKTSNGASVGDLFQSFIETCRLNGVNPYAYLTAVLRNVSQVADHPKDWMPWNFEATLAARGHARAERSQTEEAPTRPANGTPEREVTRSSQPAGEPEPSPRHPSTDTPLAPEPMARGIPVSTLPEGIAPAT